MAEVSATSTAIATATTFLFLSLCSCVAAEVFDVTKYGAVADGNFLANKPLWTAFNDACKSTSPSQVLIPQGTFLLGQIKMEGPCKAPIEIHLQGTLKAVEDPSLFTGEDGWVTLNYIDRLVLTGGGVFDGQGKRAWSVNECRLRHNCKIIPNIRFNFVTNSLVSDVTTLNSKNFHVILLGCKNLTFNHFTVTAPWDSPNTDGIHIGSSVGVNITDSNIRTGDDCISLGAGSRDVFATRVWCGPGHGFSVGSLGKLPNEEPVAGFTIKNCTFSGTQNGIRIKTWPASYPGTVSNVYAEDVRMVHVDNPIVIDQIYCPWNQCNSKIPSQVQISDVTFTNIWGTSETQVAVELNCSSKVPCQNVRLSNISLKSGTQRGGPTTSTCANVKPITGGTLIPSICSRV